jgi:hypothetical protein
MRLRPTPENGNAISSTVIKLVMFDLTFYTSRFGLAWKEHLFFAR